MKNLRAKRQPSSQTTSRTTSEGDGRSTSDMPLSEDFLERMHILRCTLEADLLSCDAKWTLFVAAALSYRYDSLLRPFPPRFVSEQSGCNIDALVSVINDTPKLCVVLRSIREQNFDECEIEVLELLFWVLVELREPALRPVDDDEYDSLLHCINCKSKLERPTHIFEVHQQLGSATESMFHMPSSENAMDLGYYGSKLDSFFTVINYGFMQHPCSANSYAGEPLVLKQQLAASLTQSPIGAGWGASSCGSMIACVAICEYLNQPDHVEFKDNKSSDAGTDIIVHNSDLVHVRYLLFYGSRFPEEDTRERDLLTWVNRHKYSLSLAAYMLMLASIGVANSGSGQYIKHLLSKKACLVLDFCKRIFVSE